MGTICSVYHFKAWVATAALGHSGPFLFFVSSQAGHQIEKNWSIPSIQTAPSRVLFLLCAFKHWKYLSQNLIQYWRKTQLLEVMMLFFKDLSEQNKQKQTKLVQWAFWINVTTVVSRNLTFSVLPKINMQILIVGLFLMLIV